MTEEELATMREQIKAAAERQGSPSPKPEEPKPEEPILYQGKIVVNRDGKLVDPNAEPPRNSDDGGWGCFCIVAAVVGGLLFLGGGCTVVVDGGDAIYPLLAMLIGACCLILAAACEIVSQLRHLSGKVDEVLGKLRGDASEDSQER